MIDPKIIGKEYPEFSFEIEKGKIREFAKAIGDKNPVYYDEDAAREAGLEGLAMPPTFPIVFALAGGLANAMIDLKVDMSKVLHSGQEYEYIKPVKPGDTVTGTMKIANVFEKSGKGGVMDFILFETTYVNQNNEKVLLDKCTLLVRR